MHHAGEVQRRSLPHKMADQVDQITSSHLCLSLNGRCFFLVRSHAHVPHIRRNGVLVHVFSDLSALDFVEEKVCLLSGVHRSAADFQLAAEFILVLDVVVRKIIASGCVFENDSCVCTHSIASLRFSAAIRWVNAPHGVVSLSVVNAYLLVV